MNDTFLSIFHSVTDSQLIKGCLSIYYSESIPYISFTQYSLHNTHTEVISLSFVQQIVISNIEKNELNIFISGQPFPSTFFFNSIFDLYTLIQIFVSNGIVISNLEKNNTWIPSIGSKPSDPVDWILQNSSLQSNFQSLHHNSYHPYSLSILGNSFSYSSHREILKQLVKKGLKSNLYQLMNNPINLNFLDEFKNENKLNEYLTIKKQWQSRIYLQEISKSKHNLEVEKISKDLIRTVSNEGTIKLLYNVLRTLITFSPDLGFAQGMVDISYFISQLVLEDFTLYDEKSQSIVFWALYNLMFKFGQSKWYISNQNSNQNFIDDISQLLSFTYPAISSFVSFNDYELFKYTISCNLTMFTRTISFEILKKISNIILFYKNIDIIYVSILSTILILEFPELNKSRFPDISKIANLINNNYKISEINEFLAIIAAISEKISKRDEENESMYLTFKLFKPLLF